MTEPQMGGTYEDLLAAARYAGRAGLAAFARSDHYLSGGDPPAAATDALASLAGLARETRRIRLGVLMSPVTFRHPAVIAKTAATIDQMSGGRLDLGVGTGWMEHEHQAFGLPFPDWQERFDRLEETLGYLRAAFGDEGGGFRGKHYRLHDIEVRPRPAGLRLLVGGSGAARTPRLAAAYADEYNQLMAPAADVAQRIATARRAAGERGRDPTTLVFSVMGQVVVGRNEDSFRERLAAGAARRGRSPEEHEVRLRERGIPMGTPAQVAHTLAGLAEAGVEKLYVQHLDLSDISGLDETFEVLLNSPSR